MINPKQNKISSQMNTIQGIFQKVLYYFVNYGYLKEGRLQSLYCPQILTKIKKYIASIVPFINELHKDAGYFPHLEKSVIELANTSYPTRQYIAKIISLYYQEREDVFKELESSPVKVVYPQLYRLDEFPRYRDDFEYLCLLDKEISFIKNHLRDFLQSAFLFGSFGSNDYKKYWSDSDILIVVKRSVLTDPEKLLELACMARKGCSMMYYLDPMQMHGYFVLAETEYMYYPQSFFPLVLFEYSKSIFDKKQEIGFFIRRDDNECRNAFYNEYQYFLSSQKSPCIPARFKGRNLFFKFILHRLLTIPLFYLQAMGKHVYKKYSFEMAKTEFPPDLWNTVKIATRIRSEWDVQFSIKYFPEFLVTLDHAITSSVLSRYNDIKKDLPRHFNVDLDELTSKLESLSEYAWNKIKTIQED